MLRFLLSVILVAGAVSTSLAQGINTTTRIAYDRTEHDVRVVPVGKELTIDFKVISAGFEPVVLYKVKPDCECTSVTFPKDPIAPGSFGIISVKYTPDKPGKFTHSVFVQSNAANSPRTELKFSGFCTAKQPQ